MTTFTRSTASVPATRGRPFWFNLDLEIPAAGGGLVSLEGADVSGVLAWEWAREQASASIVDGTPRLTWTAEQTRNLPVSPAPRVLITIVDTAGEYHDIEVTVTTIIVPLMSDTLGGPS